MPLPEEQTWPPLPLAEWPDTYATLHMWTQIILMYDGVRASSSPRERLLQFLQRTYEAGATLGNWDRDAREGPKQLQKAA